jgi:hypothetical protein
MKAYNQTIMAREQSQRVAELEVSTARLEQREKRLRAAVSSAFTSDEIRRDARDELESLLHKQQELEDELLLLESPDEIQDHKQKVRKNKTGQRSDRDRVRNKDR